MLKLSYWASKNGFDNKMAYRLFRSWKLPGQVEQLPTGTILAHEIPARNKGKRPVQATEK